MLLNEPSALYHMTFEIVFFYPIALGIVSRITNYIAVTDVVTEVMNSRNASVKCNMHVRVFITYL